MLISLFWIALGLVVLAVGGELLVRGASALAITAGISPLVVGLTVVAYGTSAPELAVNLQAAFSGESDIAVGNVVGSNICNVLLVLGVSALVAPLVVSSQLIRFDVPLMIAVSILMLLLSLDGSIGRIEGLFLLVGAMLYTGWTVVQGRKETEAVQHELATRARGSRAPGWTMALGQVVLVAIGIALLWVGARWFVDGAVSIARLLGVSELIIGLTIVAVGTSMPEIVTSIVAAARGAREIAVGNVVGSNLFNILLVLGLAAAASPDGLSVAASAIRFDVPVMIVAAAACLPVFFTGNCIARWEGGLFLAYYLAYTLFLALDAMQVAGVHGLFANMLWFVAPLTAVTLLVSVLRQFGSRRR